MQVKVGNRVTTRCRTTKGLKQGHGWSPTLFKIYLESVLYTLKKKCRNMGLPTGAITIHHQYIIFFADDPVIG